jgi:hypothetical protein
MYMGTLQSIDQGVSLYSERVIENIIVLRLAEVISARGMTIKGVAYGKDSGEILRGNGQKGQKGDTSHPTINGPCL